MPPISGTTRHQWHEHQSYPQGRPLKKLGSTITSLAAARHKRQKAQAQKDAETLEQLMLRVGYTAHEAASKALQLADQTPSRNEQWMFSMISNSQNKEVVRWLNSHSKRPRQATDLWATLPSYLDWKHGEIMRTRAQLAEEIGLAPNDLSKIMAELESINAIRRERDGRGVRYYLNPNIQTRMNTEEERATARESAGPVLAINNAKKTKKLTSE